MIDPQLRQALNFSDEELAFNRQLRFSPRQEADERKGNRGYRNVIFLIIALWLLAAVPAWLTRLEIILEFARLSTESG